MAKTEVALQKVNINSPQAMAKFATTLKEFIVDRKLYAQIKNKNYVMVEGWEFAGASIGVFPIVRETIDLSDDKQIKYKCRVELVLISKGTVLGAGEAICSNKESSKRSFDEYAICSMAQTRAIGKAYRNAFGWLMKMAGYEPTPAEEYSEFIDATPSEPAEDLMLVRERVEKALDKMTPADRMRALKGTGHTNVEKLEDRHWYTLDIELKTKPDNSDAV